MFFILFLINLTGTPACQTGNWVLSFTILSRSIVILFEFNGRNKLNLFQVQRCKLTIAFLIDLDIFTLVDWCYVLFTTEMRMLARTAEYFVNHMAAILYKFPIRHLFTLQMDIDQVIIRIKPKLLRSALSIVLMGPDLLTWFTPLNFENG